MSHNLPLHLSLTQRPLLLSANVVAEYDRRLQAAFENQGDVSLLNRFKRRKKNKKTQALNPQMADGAVRFERLPDTDLSLSDEAADKIATLSIEGPLLQKACWIHTEEGRVLIIDGYDRIEELLAQLAADDTVKGIFVKGDTPGGMVVGCFELADKIKAWSSEKPILWYNENMTASAGYALASACTEIHSLPSAVTGSIGVIYARYDVTDAMDKAGVALNIFKSDEKKDFGNPEVALTDQESLDRQEEVNLIAVKFRDMVSAHRSVQPKDIVALQAGVFMGDQAQDHKLIDGQGDLAAAKARLAALISGDSAPIENPSTQSDTPPKSQAISTSESSPAKRPKGPAASTPTITIKETDMSNTRSRILLTASLTCFAMMMAMSMASSAEIEDDDLKTEIDDEAKKRVEDMDDEEVDALNEDEDMDKMDEEGDDLEAEDEKEVKRKAEDDDEKPSARVAAAQIAYAAVNRLTPKATASKRHTPAPKGQISAATLSGIMGLKAAKGREPLAAQLAASGLSVDQADAALKSAPKGGQAANAAALQNIPSHKPGTGTASAPKDGASPLDKALAEHQAKKAGGRGR